MGKKPKKTQKTSNIENENKNLHTSNHLQVAVSFIGGGNRSTRRKPPTYRKSLTNFIT